MYQYVRYLEDDSGVLVDTESQLFSDMMGTVERVARVSAISCSFIMLQKFI